MIAHSINTCHQFKVKLINERMSKTDRRLLQFDTLGGGAAFLSGQFVEDGLHLHLLLLHLIVGGLQR